MNVIDLLITTLTTAYKYPVFLQGTFSGDDYPDNFFTYFVNESPDRQHYDNKADSWTWDITVIYYTKDAALLSTMPKQSREALQAVGFIPQGKGRNTFSDDPNFTGWATEFLFLDKN